MKSNCYTPLGAYEILEATRGRYLFNNNIINMAAVTSYHIHSAVEA